MSYEQIALAVVLAVILITRAVREASGRREEGGPANAKPSSGRAAPNALRKPASSEPSFVPRSAPGTQSAAPEARPALRRRTPQSSTRERTTRVLEAASGQPSPGVGDARRLRAAIRVMTILAPPRALSAASGEALRQRKRERRQGQR
jgi:hypothetical protein